MKRYAALAVAILALTAMSSVRADMNGNTFTSQQHQISFARPDGSWEVREHPAHKHAVALFSNGNGRVIALLSHKVIDPSDVLSTPAALRERWPSLINEIVSMTSTGESGASMDDAEYKIADDGITFEMMYANRSPAMGGDLRNWVTGFMVRGSDDKQHVYALRCAAASSVYDIWASQFEMIAPSLRFTGQKQVPFYTSPPIPWYWFALGGGVLLMILMFARRGRNAEPTVSTRARYQPAPQTQPQSMPPMDDVNADGIPNVPDNMLMAADLDSPTDDIPDQMYHEAAEEDNTYQEQPAQAGFWKCQCGRMNSGNEDFCVRCNADRVNA